jgi:hypothetical protein
METVVSSTLKQEFLHFLAKKIMRSAIIILGWLKKINNNHPDSYRDNIQFSSR